MAKREFESKQEEAFQAFGCKTTDELGNFVEDQSGVVTEGYDTLKQALDAFEAGNYTVVLTILGKGNSSEANG